MRKVREWDPRRSARALSFWIAAVVIAVLVAMWAGVVISVNQSHDAALKAIKSDAANLAFAFDEDVTHTLDNIEGTMQAVANRMAVRQSNMNLYQWSRQFPIVTAPIIEAAIISPKGAIISGTWSAKLPVQSVAGEDYFRVPRANNFKGMFIGRPAKEPAHGEMLMPISERVETLDGHLIAVLVFFVSPAKLTTLYQSINVGQNGAIALASTNGIILARYTRATPDWVDNSPSSNAPRIGLQFVAENSDGSFVQQSPIDHITRLYAYRRGWDYPLIVAVGLDYQEGLALARAHARMLYTLAISASLLLCGFALYLMHAIRNSAKRDAQLAAMQLDQTLGQWKPQPRAFVFFRNRVLDLAERFQRHLNFIRRHANAGIGDHKTRRVIAFRHQGHRDMAGFGEFHRVGQQIDQHLPQPECITADHRPVVRNIRMQRDLLLVRLNPHCRDGVGHQIGRVEHLL